MAIRLRFKGGILAGKVYKFGDDVEEIVIGRDPDKCHVVLPSDMTAVSRQHVAIVQQLGRYRLRVQQDNPVYVDGREAMNEMQLGPVAEL
jgi:predicted component of type VI protein secretion system